MKIIAGGLDDPRVVDLLALHLATALAISPRESCHALDLAGLKSPDVSFWSAWDGETLLGVGALKELTQDRGEVKSMHTRRSHRGQGVGGALLRRIVETAAARGYALLSLETGAQDEFAPARLLYASHGFLVCEPFGDYVLDPNSVFMSLDLSTKVNASRVGPRPPTR